MKRRMRGAQQERAGDSNLLQRLTKDPLLKRAQVGADVGQLRHESSLPGAAPNWQQLRSVGRHRRHGRAFRPAHKKHSGISSTLSHAEHRTGRAMTTGSSGRPWFCVMAPAAQLIGESELMHPRQRFLIGGRVLRHHIRELRLMQRFAPVPEGGDERGGETAPP